MQHARIVDHHQIARAPADGQGFLALKLLKLVNNIFCQRLAVLIAHDADAEARLLGKGRLVIRPSGTEPVIRVMAEGDDEHLVQQVVGEIAEAVRKAAQAL